MDNVDVEAGVGKVSIGSFWPISELVKPIIENYEQDSYSPTVTGIR
jgi:hypothetical protein